jgi:hypothetical protein
MRMTVCFSADCFTHHPLDITRRLTGFLCYLNQRLNVMLISIKSLEFVFKACYRSFSVLSLHLPVVLFIQALSIKTMGRFTECSVCRWSAVSIRIWINTGIVEWAGRWLCGSFVKYTFLNNHIVIQGAQRLPADILLGVYTVATEMWGSDENLLFE